MFIYSRQYVFVLIGKYRANLQVSSFVMSITFSPLYK